jgi:benzil reductase ((S)-benzoin forming)
MLKKRVLITGGSSGIGQALAWRLADLGCQVCIVGRNATRCKQTTDYNPKQIKALIADIVEEKALEQLKAHFQEQSLDYLVHCAGSVDPMLPLDAMPRKDFEYNLQINCIAPLFLTIALKPVFAKQARVLWIDSDSRLKARKGWSHYSISKAAATMMVASLRLEWSKDPIFIGLAKPGFIKTPLTKKALDADIENFPDKKIFTDALAQGLANSPEVAAHFFSWLLTETTDEDFSELEWDLRHASHQGHWHPDK